MASIRWQAVPVRYGMDRHDRLLDLMEAPGVTRSSWSTRHICGLRLLPWTTGSLPTSPPLSRLQVLRLHLRLLALYRSSPPR